MEKIITKDYITDYKTNKVYISSLIDRESGDLDENTRGRLKSCIENFCSECEPMLNTRDVWARDYMPIQLTKDVFLGYTFKPDYLVEKYQNCITNWQLHNVHTLKRNFDNLNIVQMPLILDGGNVVKALLNGKPYMIMCEKVLKENNVIEKEFRDWWSKWWKNNFNGTEMGLVLLPWEGQKYNPIGHADGMVRYIGDGQLLMTNYMDYEKKDKDYFGSTMKDILEKAGFKVETLDFWDNFKNDYIYQLLFDESWCYINYLQVGNKILVPSLGYHKLDDEARRQIEEAFKKANQQVIVQTIECNMTPIVKNMNDSMNSGGALNCLTWTIQSKTRE